MMFMKKLSRYWRSSTQPRKQRKWRFNAPLHAKHKLISAHLSEDLRKSIKKRSLPLRKGDEVVVMRGNFKKKSGKVSKIDLSESKVYIEGIKRKKVSGQEVEVAFDPSNLLIKKITEDKGRFKVKK